MIHIVHGDDIVSSRHKLSELSSGFSSVTSINVEKQPFTDVLEAFSSSDLFVDKKCIVIEKVLKLPKKEMDKLLELLSSLDQSTTVILWHNTELSKVFLSKFSKVTVDLFLLPKLFFTFLDELTPRTIQKEIDTLFKMEHVEAEQVFYAMVKRVRQILLLKSNTLSEEIDKMSPWQMQKIQSQASQWDIDMLEHFYKNLVDIEVKMKSGGLFLPLRKHLDIALIEEVH